MNRKNCGTIDPDDMNGIDIGMGVHDKKNILINFNRDVKWILFSKDEALRFAKMILDTVSNIK